MSLLSALRDRIGAAFTKVNTIRPPVALNRGLSGLLHGGQQPHSLVADMQAYGSVGWLFAVVTRISQSVATAEWRLFSRQSNGERAEITGPHRLKVVLNRPNPFTTRSALMEQTQQYLDLTGEAWWVLLRNGLGLVTEIWPVRPDRMRPIPDAQEFIAGYEYRIASVVIPLDIEDVVFMRMPNPLDPLRGLGPVQAIFPDLSAERAAALWTTMFFENGAVPGGIIMFDEALSQEEYDEFVDRWRSQHRGVSNAHRVAILEKAKWQDIKFSQRDMQFEQLRKLNRDTILGVYGVPLSVMGITESVNRANAEAGEVTFTKWVVRPRLERIKEAINMGISALFGDDLEWDYDDPTPLNRELNSEVADRAFLGGYATMNEARDLIGLGAVKGPEGDEFKPAAVPASPFALGWGDGRVKQGAQDHVDISRPLAAAERRMEERLDAILRAERERVVRALEEAEGG